MMTAKIKTACTKEENEARRTKNEAQKVEPFRYLSPTFHIAFTHLSGCENSIKPLQTKGFRQIHSDFRKKIDIGVFVRAGHSGRGRKDHSYR